MLTTYPGIQPNDLAFQRVEYNPTAPYLYLKYCNYTVITRYTVHQ